MKFTLLLPVAAAAAIGIAALSTLSALPNEGATAQPRGHLILQIEGDANGLRVVRVTPKPDPLGHLADVPSTHRVVVRLRDGGELASVPLDLSHFDLDPANVGRDASVTGCVVRETCVAALANVPHFDGDVVVEIRAGARVVGGLDADGYARMLRAAEGR